MESCSTSKYSVNRTIKKFIVWSVSQSISKAISQSINSLQLIYVLLLSMFRCAQSVNQRSTHRLLNHSIKLLISYMRVGYLQGIHRLCARDTPKNQKLHAKAKAAGKRQMGNGNQFTQAHLISRSIQHFAAMGFSPRIVQIYEANRSYSQPEPVTSTPLPLRSIGVLVAAPRGVRICANETRYQNQNPRHSTDLSVHVRVCLCFCVCVCVRHRSMLLPI